MGASRRINAFCVVAFTLFAAATAQQCSTKLNGYLILAEEGSIVKVDASGENREVLTSSVKQAISLDFDYHRNILYWAELESAEIYALDEGASKPRLVIPKQKQWLPFSVTVDSVTEKLYVGDGFSGTVRIFDLKNDKLEGIVVGNDLREVRSIGIDINAGYLFVNDRYQILRTDLDGSNRKVLYEYKSEFENEIVPQFIRHPISVFRILVDPETKRLYWIDSWARNIVSSDYGGQDKKIVFQARDGQPIAESLGSLAILSNYLYWSDVENNVVYKIDLESSSSSSILSAAPFFIKAISCPSQKSISNPCAQNNGDCEQLCVLSKDSKGNHKCACQVGYELAKDQRSCIKVRNFLLFTQDNYIRGQSINTDGEAHDDVINPSQFPVGRLALVDYNAEAGVVYHNGLFPHNHLYQVNLDSGEESKLEPNLLSKDIRALAYDWVSKNLYYFTYYYADQITLSVLNVEDPTYSKIIVNDVQRLVAGLVVHPHKGYVYFGQNNDDRDYARIFRVNSDGSDLKVVVDLGKGISIAGLAIDFEENRLYWSQSERSGYDYISTLRNSNLDGGDVVSVNLPENLNFAELAIHKDQIYGINGTQTQILRLNKENLSNKAVLVRDSLPGTLSGLKIFSKEVQNVKSDHPCAVGKHQCGKFCFAVEGKAVCGCPYGEKLDVDGKTCIDNSKVEPPFKPCLYTSFKCKTQTV